MRTEGQMEILRTRFKTEVTNTLTPFLSDINEMHSTLSGTGKEECSRNITRARGWTTEESVRRLLPMETYFFLSTASKSALESAQPSIHCALEAVRHVGKAHGK